MKAQEIQPQASNPTTSWADGKEIGSFIVQIERFARDEMSADEFKSIRLHHGVYGQRQPGVQMVRVKIPGGRLTADQFAALGRVAGQYGKGLAHVTTRQDIQYHYVKLEDVPQVLRELAETGLTTREAGGNSVRNVTACPLAGVCAREEFDVRPRAEATARLLLRNPGTQRLPRKFKIAFSGCAQDCALAGINDVGLLARTEQQNGQTRRGFRLLAGGGLGSWPRPAMRLSDFVPVEELPAWVESIAAVFNQFGNRKNRARARLKFVLAEKGFDWFRDQVHAGVRERGVKIPEPRLQASSPHPEAARIDEARPHTAALVQISPNGGDSQAIGRWGQTNVWRQRQEGLVAVWVTLPQGALRKEQFEALANLARRHGDGTLRTTPTQNVILPNVKQENLSAVYAELNRAQLALPGVQEISDVTSCPGAETCNLGITRSRSLSEALDRQLRAEEDPETRRIRIKISGCPNSCGHHHIADIGFHGLSRKVEGEAAPYYQLLLGGNVNPDSSQFGQRVTVLPARRVPEAVERLLAFYRGERHPNESFFAFVSRRELDDFRKLLAELGQVNPADPVLRQDWGQEGAFQLEVGVGECAS